MCFYSFTPTLTHFFGERDDKATPSKKNYSSLRVFSVLSPQSSSGHVVDETRCVGDIGRAATRASTGMEGRWTGGHCLVMWATFIEIHGLFVPRFESGVGGWGGGALCLCVWLRGRHWESRNPSKCWDGGALDRGALFSDVGNIH